MKLPPIFGLNLQSFCVASFAVAFQIQRERKRHFSLRGRSLSARSEMKKAVVWSGNFLVFFSVYILKPMQWHDWKRCANVELKRRLRLLEISRISSSSWPPSSHNEVHWSCGNHSSLFPETLEPSLGVQRLVLPESAQTFAFYPSGRSRKRLVIFCAAAKSLTM